MIWIRSRIHHRRRRHDTPVWLPQISSANHLSDPSGTLVSARQRSNTYLLFKMGGTPGEGGVSRWGRTRGDGTYNRAVAAGCKVLRRDGIRGVSFRRVAEATGVSIGAIQCHFRTHDELVRAAVGAWADGISRSLEEAAGDARGLRRTWKLCELWIGVSDGVHVVLEAIPVEADRSEHPTARAAVVERLRRWINETRRSLAQAQLQHELNCDADIHGAAVEIHQLLWSQPWTAAVQGREAAKRGTLRAIWQRLAAIAIDPAATLPPSPEVVPARASKDDDEYEMLDLRSDHGLPTWTMLERTDPLYYAFLRHEIMGDPRTFIRPPEVNDQDRARAEEFARKNPQLPVVDWDAA